MTLSTVYGLCDPRDGSLRYIGQTVRSIDSRLDSHIYEANGDDRRPKNRWIREVLEAGLRPEVFEIEKTDEYRTCAAEHFWIAYFHSVGCSLTNQIGVPGKSNRDCERSLQRQYDRYLLQCRRKEITPPDFEVFRSYPLKKRRSIPRAS